MGDEFNSSSIMITYKAVESDLSVLDVECYKIIFVFEVSGVDVIMTFFGILSGLLFS